MQTQPLFRRSQKHIELEVGVTGRSDDGDGEAKMEDGLYPLRKVPMANPEQRPIGDDREGTIYTNSKYAFGVVHTFRKIWKERRPLNTQGHRISELLNLTLTPSGVRKGWFDDAYFTTPCPILWENGVNSITTDPKQVFGGFPKGIPYFSKNLSDKVGASIQINVVD
ncbi:hypothetical protein DUI87_19683 [Hirundo rustica rustica]|uniref:Uncharacterized protein n=1 Tax=Hirundo rustica rustica TaxID=333673 RepID=A0A3M0JU16_HIRRU|nr:hypothetical protein DUI87_19683 [Hirundo rustica rustica]